MNVRKNQSHKEGGVEQGSIDLADFTYDTFFVRIEYGVVPKKLTLNIRADFSSLGVFDYADYESDD